MSFAFLCVFKATENAGTLDFTKILGSAILKNGPKTLDHSKATIRKGMSPHSGFIKIKFAKEY